MKPIAHIKTNIEGKFGVPRQSGVIKELTGKIIFKPEYRLPEAFRGIEDFSHIWLIWDFSENETWSPTVRPPRLGGNKRLGVFATRSPFRPNSLGLSVVKLDKVELTSADGPTLYVSGIDLADGTPIYDIKPYIPYADCVADATAGFTESLPELLLTVDFPEELLSKFPKKYHKELLSLLSHDPRPAYQDDPDRVYGLTYKGHDIKFKIVDATLIVVAIV